MEEQKTRGGLLGLLNRLLGLVHDLISASPISIHPQAAKSSSSRSFFRRVLPHCSNPHVSISATLCLAP
eukprot:758247-Hanusia_phi.AAC.5